jgi:sec-independent protein translocase protein TatC
VQQDTFISHLIELRERLMRASGSVLLILFLLCLWPGIDPIYNYFTAPLGQTYATGIVTPFTVPLKVTALVAFMIALPYVLYQAWAFIAPGLYEHEKKLALPLVAASTSLFYLGVAFCYYFVLSRVFVFVANFAPKSITPMPEAEKYVSFVMTMFLAFGITFEIPIVVIVLVRSGVVSIEKLKEVRPYVIVGAFVVAAVVTPPDVLSQFMLAVPMCLLYETGLLVSRFVAVRPRAESAESQGQSTTP